MTAILLRSIEAFKLFDVDNLMTGGGPGVDTSTVTLSAYFTGIRSGNLGLAAAMTTILLIVVLIITTVLIRLLIKAGQRRGRRDRQGEDELIVAGDDAVLTVTPLTHEKEEMVGHA